MSVQPHTGIVSTPHPAASEAGRRILSAGGTAVDAAVAAAFSLTVVAPSCTGIAGYGGGALIYDAGQRAVHAVDFTSRAPATALPDMYSVRENAAGGFSVADEANAKGPLAVDTPGVLAGLVLIQRRFGTLPLHTVVQPAVQTAATGYVVDATTAKSIKATLVPNAAEFPDTFRAFSSNGHVPEVGEQLRSPRLASVLDRIGREGPDAFYRGPIARAVVDTVQRGGGRLTLDDLASYEASELSPVQCGYHGRTVVTVPLPGGGLTVLQMLRVLERIDVRNIRDETSLAHILVETAKMCWRQRLTRYGDPDYMPTSAEEELSDACISELWRGVTAGMRAPSPGSVIAPDPLDTSTVHLCTADGDGNVVTLTQTLGGSFGSLLMVPDTGIVLSHGLSRFDPRPGWPNSIAPRKRPLNNMAPILIFNADRPLLAIGGAGGRTILSNLVHVIVRAIGLGNSLEQAIAATRFHVETAEPVQVEEGDERLADGLRRLGHSVRLSPPFGGLQGLAFGEEAGRGTGVADPRRGGTVARV